MDFRGVPPMKMTGNLSENWTFWRQRFRTYLLATEISKKEEIVQCAQLLTLIGEDCVRIYNTFTFTEEEKDKLTTLIDKFDKHFNPKKNLTYQRHKFLTCRQREGETVEQYITELKNLAIGCELGNLQDGLIKDILICGILSEEMREKLLQEDHDSLDDAINKCISMENTKQHSREISNKKDNQIDAVRSNRRFHTDYGNQQMRKKSSKNHNQRKCQKCGQVHGYGKCPAYGKKCSACGNFNHFAQQCRNKISNNVTKNKNYSNKKVECIETNDMYLPANECDDEDNNFLFLGSIDKITLNEVQDNKNMEVHGLHDDKEEAWIIDMEIEGKGLVKMKLDTGAAANIIPLRNLEKIGVDLKQIEKTNTKLTSYTGPAFGELVHVTSPMNPDDHTGCQLPFGSSRSDQQLPPPGTPWIALIKRGRCNFEVKVENAFKSNAAGVLVYNDRDSASLDKMKLSSDSRRNISAIFIYKWKGDELASKLENDSKVYIHITIAGHTSSRTANINRTSVLFVSITFIVLMIISLTWLVFYYVQRFRYIRTKDKISRRLGNAAKKALSKIPTKNLKTEDREMQGDCECCAICIELYKLSETLRILPCGHEFHKSCIDPWLLEHRTCPMCKMDILKHYGFVFTGSQESILQMDGDMGVQSSLGSENSSPRHLGRLSPLPEIRAVVSDRQMPRFFNNSIDDDSSRSSTPDEMTPSLPQRGISFPVRPELCVSCIAAKAAAALTQMNNEKQIVIDEEASTSTNSDIQQVLSMDSDNDTSKSHNAKRCT